MPLHFKDLDFRIANNTQMPQIHLTFRLEPQTITDHVATYWNNCSIEYSALTHQTSGL